MPRRSQQGSPRQLRTELIELLQGYETVLTSGESIAKVQSLVPIQRKLRDLGCSLVEGSSGRARILNFLRQHVGEVIPGEMLSIVAGISEWARRTRELRVELGWPLVTGVTIKEMIEAGDIDPNDEQIAGMATSDYLLLEGEPDTETAERWQTMSSIRKERISVRDKILKYLRANVGKRVSGEELRYVAGDKTEWARRTRELRTEYGWPVVTKNTGRPDLPVGSYLLELDRQSPEHDRKIPDPVRRAVLVRDNYQCTECHWNNEMWNRSDPRNLELHHKEHHAKGGPNSPDNLTTLCNVCHDELHRNEYLPF